MYPYGVNFTKLISCFSIMSFLILLLITDGFFLNDESNRIGISDLPQS